MAERPNGSCAELFSISEADQTTALSESENHLKVRIERQSPRDSAIADSSSSVGNQKADEAQKLVRPTVAKTMTMNLRFDESSADPIS